MRPPMAFRTHASRNFEGEWDFDDPTKLIKVALHSNSQAISKPQLCRPGVRGYWWRSGEQGGTIVN